MTGPAYALLALCCSAAAGWAADKVSGILATDAGALADPGFDRMVAEALASPVWDPAGNLFAGIAAGAVMLGFMAWWTGRDERALRREVRGREFGDARWATPEEVAKYAHSSERRRKRLDPPRRGLVGWLRWLVAEPRDAARTLLGLECWVDDPTPDYCARPEDDNIILADGVELQLTPIPDFRIDRNKHVMVLGGSGAGKTHSFVIPMVLQENCFLVFTDPKGDTAERAVAYMRAKGHVARIVNIKPGNFGGARFNPLAYLDGPASILLLVDTLIKNTTGNKGQINGNADFFVKAETQLDTAIVGLVWYSYRTQPRYCTFGTVIDMLQLAKEGSQRAGRGVSVLDRIILGNDRNPDGTSFRERLIRKYGDEESAKLGEEWFVITNYRGFKETSRSPETEASVLASCNVRLTPFSIGEVRDFLSADELELERAGREPGALFLVSDDMSDTFNFLFAMLITTLFTMLARTAESSPGCHCPVPVNCVLDEFANIGEIPGFDTKIATLRSRWVNLMPILQNLDQLKKWYKDTAGIIDGNCDTLLFLGSAKDKETREYVSELCGKRTIPVRSESQTKGSHGSWQVSYSTQGQPLIAPAELITEPDKFGKDDCIVIINSERPIRAKKYDPTTHPRWAEWQAAGASGVTTASLRAEMDAMAAATVEVALSVGDRPDDGLAVADVSWDGLLEGRAYELEVALLSAGDAVELSSTRVALDAPSGTKAVELPAGLPALAGAGVLARARVECGGDVWARFQTAGDDALRLPSIDVRPKGLGIPAASVLEADGGVEASFDLKGLVVGRHYTLDATATAAGRTARASKPFAATASRMVVKASVGIDLDGLPGDVSTRVIADVLPGSAVWLDDDLHAHVWLEGLDPASSYSLRASLPDAGWSDERKMAGPPRSCEVSFAIGSGDAPSADTIRLDLSHLSQDVGLGHGPDPSHAVRVPHADGRAESSSRTVDYRDGTLSERLRVPELRRGETLEATLTVHEVAPDDTDLGLLRLGGAAVPSATARATATGTLDLSVELGHDQVAGKRLATTLDARRSGTHVATETVVVPPRGEPPGGW